MHLFFTCLLAFLACAKTVLNRKTYMLFLFLQSNAYTAMSDSYMPSYYSPSIGFTYSLNEAAWSTGGDPPMPYLASYGQLSNGEHHFSQMPCSASPGHWGATLSWDSTASTSSPVGLTSLPGGTAALRDSPHRAQVTAAVTPMPLAR